MCSPCQPGRRLVEVKPSSFTWFAKTAISEIHAEPLSAWTQHELLLMQDVQPMSAMQKATCTTTAQGQVRRRWLAQLKCLLVKATAGTNQQEH